jgi:hypothetical protein
LISPLFYLLAILSNRASRRKDLTRMRELRICVTLEVIIRWTLNAPTQASGLRPN